VPREEALRRARAELGSLAAVRENSRQAWGTRFLDELRGDLRLAIRVLAKSPGFTAIAIGSLALGIGANTAIFTAAQHMLLDRLDVPHPEQLRLFGWTAPRNGVVESLWGQWDDLPGGGMVSTSFSFPVYRQLRRENRSLADVFAFKGFGRMVATVDGHAQPVGVEMVSGNYYAGLEVKPQLGRAIEESDDGAVGSGPVVTISDGFWARQFGRSPDVIGKTILVDAVPMTIVGVNPRGFTGAYSAQESPDIFLPFSMEPIVAPEELSDGKESLLQNRSIWWVLVMGRLKPGVPPAAANAALNVALQAAVRTTMTVPAGKAIPRLLLRDGSRGQNPYADSMVKPVAVLMGLAGFVLLLACANLANLLLARTGARQREMSVRLALGAGRARILRQMLTESLLVSLLGGAAGILIAWAGHNAIPRLFAHAWEQPPFAAHFNWPIFLFAAAISVLTGLMFGMAPAWQAARVQVSSGLKDSGQTVTHRRRGLGGRAIVVVQIALSLLLVVIAGLFVQTLMKLGRAPLGFEPHQRLLFSLQIPQSSDAPASLRLIQQIENRLSALPGVQSVTAMTVPLISGNVSTLTFVPEGEHYARDSRPRVEENTVGNGFFTTFGIPLIAGRSFNPEDTPASRKVAIINQSLARKFFSDRNPVGTTFTAGWNHPYLVQIVGVCADAKYNSLRDKPEPTVYLPLAQRAGGLTEPTFAIATSLAGESILPSVRDAVASVDRNVPVLDVRTQDEQIAASLQQPKIFAGMTTGFGVLALLLASIGIYGIMAYSVSRRTNEIGIRMALGAERGRVLRMVVGEAFWMVAIGIAAGLAAALTLGRLIGSMLYGLKPWDPATYALSGALLILVALAATWIPAHRAAGVDPMKALRHE
ncbi:MAG TPA: ABC transporter permease, partial [Acidobacteriaceae bacterium]|nr:ABC transporter permease [Acidobacteriaceae bacterium]